MAMRRASPWFAGAAVCIGLVFAALAYTGDDGVSERWRFVATWSVVGFSILAVVLGGLGVRVWWQMSNGRLCVRPADTTTVMGTHILPSPLLRLQFVNRGNPGQFHAQAWWVDDGVRDGVWDVCWQNTDQTAIHIDDERVINLLALVGAAETVRPVRPSFPTIDFHTGGRSKDGDWVVELAVWRTGNKKPLRTRWELRERLGEWSLEQAE